MRAAQLSRALDDVATRSLPLPARVDLFSIALGICAPPSVSADAIEQIERDQPESWSCDEDMSR